MTKLENNTQQTWIALARSYRTILEEVERSLKKAGLPPLGWYDVLLEVERSGPNGIRPYTLQERLLLPQYGMSRLLDRLEKNGLIDKLQCEDDKRGFEVCISEKGKKIRQEMWPVYAASLKGSVEDKLTDREAEELARLLGKLKNSAG